jgi:hypothetical protein
MKLSHTVDLPDEALHYHLVVYGKTRSGKTYALKGIIEKLMDAGRRVCIIDPTSAYWGLKYPGEGGGKGFGFVIFGGKHADVPIDDRAAAPLAELIMGNHIPAIIDTQQMKGAARTRFFTRFAEELLRLADPAKPLHLVIDEAHLFAPKNLPQGSTKGSDDDKANPAMMLHNTVSLATGGGSQGIRIMAASQRPAKLHNDVASQCETLIAMRVMHPTDRKAVEEWIEGAGDAAKAKEVLSSLARLKRGEGWVWYPDGDILAKTMFPKIRSFDSSRTPDDKGFTLPPSKMADIDLSAVRNSMAQAIEDAEAKDPKKLRARIEQLEGELADAKAGGEPDPDANGSSAMQADIDRLEQHNTELQNWIDEIRQQVAHLRTGIRQLVQASHGNQEILESVADRIALIPEGWAKDAARLADTGGNGIYVPPPRPVAESPTAATRANGAARPRVATSQATPLRSVSESSRTKAGATGNRPSAPAGGSNLEPRQFKVLESLAKWHARGVREVTREQCAFIAGRGSSSSSYDNDLGKLRTAGLITYPSGGTLSLTPAGQALVPSAKRFTAAELYQGIRNALEPRQVAIVDALMKHGGLARGELAKASGRGGSSSSFDNDLGKLRSLTIVDYPEKGSVDLTEWVYRITDAGRSA